MKLRGLRQARQRQGLSISQLAEMTGLRRESISRFEHGQEEPQPYALRRLATVLETSLAELGGLSADEASVISKSASGRVWLLRKCPLLLQQAAKHIEASPRGGKPRTRHPGGPFIGMPGLSVVCWFWYGGTCGAAYSCAAPSSFISSERSSSVCLVSRGLLMTLDVPPVGRSCLGGSSSASWKMLTRRWRDSASSVSCAIDVCIWLMLRVV